MKIGPLISFLFIKFCNCLSRIFQLISKIKRNFRRIWASIVAQVKSGYDVIPEGGLFVISQFSPRAKNVRKKTQTSRKTPFFIGGTKLLYKLRRLEKLFRGSNFVQKFGPSYKKRRRKRLFSITKWWPHTFIDAN